ncbi:MAG TPA: Mu transposase C-terminal domain-containing protein [Gammaproteobacteria bacterium]|nr:Mu transposase C-terminal domain-containing protein [Gammaproteobacteria bacterium]
MNSPSVSCETGTQVVWNAREYTIAGMWSGTEVLLRDPATGKSHVAKALELQPHVLESAGAASPPLHGMCDEQWNALIQRFNSMARLSELERPSKADFRMVADELDVSVATARRYFSKYKRTGMVSALMSTPPGPKAGARQLPAAVESLIGDEIKSRWLTREETCQAEFVKTVQRIARTQGLKAPSGKSIIIRLRNLPGRESLRKRRGGKDAGEQYEARTGTHKVDNPLGEVQTDATLVDIIVVSDDKFRNPISRPFLTLSIDVCTRAIVGYYLSLDKPDAYATGLCVAMACLPKDPLLKDMGITDAAWPMQGRMKKLYVDNAKEYRSLALRRGCDTQLIVLEYRPPGRPYYGGHIERLMGTMMRRLHALPGSTRSNIVMRGEYDPAATAVMTLPELHKYLLLQILAYNSEVHSSLGMSPNRAWELAFAGKDASQLPVVPPASPQFFASFMPFQRRTIRRDGVELYKNRYWDAALAPLIGHPEKLEVHYDPRDMSRVLVRDPGGLLIPVSYADSTLPRISLREWTFIKRRASAEGRCPHEVVVNDQLLNQADAVEEEATQKQRKAQRKRREALKHTLGNADRTQRLYGVWPSPAAPIADVPTNFNPDAISPFTVDHHQE